MDLRPYQSRAIGLARDQHRRGSRSILIVAPTGAGKTFLGVSIAISAIAKGGTVLWLAHRMELLQQAAESISRSGETPGIIAPWAPATDARIQVASVQTLLAREQRPQASVVVLDECHHFLAKEWGQVADSYSRCLRIGLTATPERQDGVGLGNLFTSIVPVCQPRELIESGYLVPCRVLRPPRGSGNLAEDPVEAWRRLGRGGKAIVFAASVRAARDIASRFEAIGVPARAITGSLDSPTRQVAVDRFRSGSVRVLTGVHTLTEGLDVPDVSVAILARGFTSRGAYIQAVGRVMRPAPGKSEAIVLDLTGCSIEHGLPDDDRVYSLEGKPISTKEGLLPIRQCPACGHVFRAAQFHGVRPEPTRDGNVIFVHFGIPRPRCPGCGYEMPLKKDPRVVRREMQLASDSHSDDRRISQLKYFFQDARAKGHKPGRALIRFKIKYGRWPTQAEKSLAGWR